MPRARLPDLKGGRQSALEANKTTATGVLRLYAGHCRVLTPDPWDVFLVASNL
jgi:hypothetical protein